MAGLAVTEALGGSDDLMRRFEALRTGRAGRLVLGSFGTLTVQYARQEVPQKTRNLHRSIRVDEVDVARQLVRVVAGGTRQVGYAAHVEFGTRAHVIVPRNRKALAWGGPRRLSGSLRSGARPTSFATRVNHPGTRPQPYLRPAAERALRDVGLADAVVQVWNAAA